AKLHPSPPPDAERSRYASRWPRPCDCAGSSTPKPGCCRNSKDLVGGETVQRVVDADRRARNAGVLLLELELLRSELGREIVLLLRLQRACCRRRQRNPGVCDARHRRSCQAREWIIPNLCRCRRGGERRGDQQQGGKQPVFHRRLHSKWLSPMLGSQQTRASPQSEFAFRRPA